MTTYTTAPDFPPAWFLPPLPAPSLGVKRAPRVVNFGGGVNSTGLLVEAWRRGEATGNPALHRPDYIVFADTGSEMPYTYEHLASMQDWLASISWPQITIVRWIRVLDSRVKERREAGAVKGAFVSLEKQCIDGHELPSKAYGYSGCTSKWKQQPADDFVERVVHANHAGVLNHYPIERWIGFDADEPSRFDRMMEKDPQPKDGMARWQWRAPLIEWDMGRDECAAVIAEHARVDGRPMQVPRKSACFFCPSSKKKDVLWLQQNYPELLERALKIEDGAREAGLTDIKGLGRSAFAWRDFLANEKTGGLRVIDENHGETSCGCYDGDE